MEFAREVAEIRAAQICQLLVLEMLPKTFGRIQIRGVAGEEFRLQLPRTHLTNKQLHQLGPMNGGSVPDNPEPAKSLEQVGDKQDHIPAVQRRGSGVDADLSLRSDPTDDREVVSRQRHFQKNPLSSRRVGVVNTGQQVKPALIQQK